MIVVRSRDGQDNGMRIFLRGIGSRVVREIMERHIKGNVIKNDKPIQKADKQEPTATNIENKEDNFVKAVMEIAAIYF